MQKILVGVDGSSREARAMYIGVEDKAKKVKKIYVGVNGVAKPCYVSAVVKETPVK